MSVETFLLSLLLGMSLCSSVYGDCQISDRVDGCQYTVYCNGNAGSVYSSGCDNEPNVTFIMQRSNTYVLSLAFFSRTNFDTRVRAFNAISNHWDQIEPSTFKYYKKTEFMDLSQNRIHVIENEAFTDLINLRQLNLSDNIIQELHDKSLQISAVAQNSLEVLDLSKNLLTSLGVGVFSNLPNLKVLLLKDNQIKEMEGNCFSVQRQLLFLSLENNKIPTINTSLVTMSELKYLDLSRNFIKKLSGIDMIHLVSLIQLNVSQNVIETIEFNCFNQAFQLEVLDLSYNRITSPIEMQMFLTNTKLSYLNLYQNNVTILGDLIFKANKLRYLNIENNNITGDITNQTFKGLQNITSLNLTHQHIRSVRNNSFSEMYGLHHLNMSYNDIEVIENSSFTGASALTVLDLSHNFIKSLNFFKMFSSNLTDIYINNNLITIITEHVFRNHSRLTRLDISSNIIITIEPNALPLFNIKYLNIRNNHLSGIIVENTLSPARFIKHLDLSHQNIKGINSSTFVNLPSLESIDLCGNQLEYIDSNNFKDVGSLSSLNISYNNLTDITIDGKLNLTTLLMSNNKFNSIPNILNFTNGANLLHLDMSFNNLSNVSYDGFKNIQNLNNLKISHNNISYFNNEFTNTLTSLSYLSLESNRLKEINLTYFTNLKSVNISDNELVYLVPSQLNNLNHLRVLDISANKIKQILPGTFQQLSNLEYLLLSSNFITDLRFGIFRGLNNTQLIDLSKNKINNINVDIFHECYKLKTAIFDYNNISSIDIERFVEVSSTVELISIGGNPIACNEIVKVKNKEFELRTLEITSIHKIYHEDNVHGIRCGDTNTNVTNDVTIQATKTEVVTDKPASENSSSTLLFVWCSVLSVVMITLGLGFAYWRYKNSAKKIDTRMQFQNTASSRNSECYSDLLS